MRGRNHATSFRLQRGEAHAVAATTHVATPRARIAGGDVLDSSSFTMARVLLKVASMSNTQLPSIHPTTLDNVTGGNIGGGAAGEARRKKSFRDKLADRINEWNKYRW
jgi:hypothetical protein